MFSSSGRDTSSWVHTEEHGKGQSLVTTPHCSLPSTSWWVQKDKKLGLSESQSWALKARASTISPESPAGRGLDPLSFSYSEGSPLRSLRFT